ncbi:MAG: A/G-specific adenine glycosylase [Verrucomicrobiota bacterium]
MPKDYNSAIPKIDAKILQGFHKDLIAWFLEHQRELPWRRKRSAYHTVVSELMLQQTQVTTVIPYFERWIKKYPNWQALALGSETDVLKLWEGLGYYRRCRNLHLLAKTIVDDLDGKVPQAVADLEKLPGIGPYTAGAVASLAFNKPAPIVDGNVERVLCRVFNLSFDVTKTENKKLLWLLSESILPQENPRHFNEGLMELGALVCTSASPQCLLCPLKKICQAKDPLSLPFKPRAKIIEEKAAFVLIEKNEKILMQKAEEEGRWQGFHRFPQFDNATMQLDRKVGALTFSITKYRVKASFSVAKLSIKKIPDKYCWINKDEISQLPLPAPHRKMLKMFSK